MQHVVGGDDPRRRQVVAAHEVGHPTARFLDDEPWSGDVPEREVTLEHDLRGTLGDEHVAPEVAEAAVAPDPIDEARRSPASARRRSVGADENTRWAVASSLDRRTRGGARPTRGPAPAGPVSSDPGATAAPGEPSPSQRRRRDDAHGQRALDLEREQGREDRHAAHVAVRAVDRVDDPAPAARTGSIALVLAVLLARRARDRGIALRSGCGWRARPRGRRRSRTRHRASPRPRSPGGTSRARSRRPRRSRPARARARRRARSRVGWARSLVHVDLLGRDDGMAAHGRGDSRGSRWRGHISAKLVGR